MSYVLFVRGYGAKMEFTGEMGFAFRSGRAGVESPAMTEQILAAHESTAASVLHMARLIAMQEGLA